MLKVLSAQEIGCSLINEENVGIFEIFDI